MSPPGVVQHAAESRAVADFLASAAAAPLALVLEGAAGIGKTTLWLQGIDQARERGFRVMSARASAAESVLAYATLADLLGGVDAAESADLPVPQRRALDKILLRAEDDGAATDQRTVAAAFASVVESLADETPVLLAIDDLQWLDPSSVRVLAFAARRLSGPVGVLATVRIDPFNGGDVAWLQMPRPDDVLRVTVPSLTLGGLQAVFSARLGRTFARPTLLRIHEISGGNPLYALELARALDDGAHARDELQLPSSLAELVRARIGRLDLDAQSLLLATACLSAPTIDLVAAATGAETERVTKVLEDAEDKGIIAIEGNRLRFSHPLLATGVYTEATAAQRREMHRRLAKIVSHPELKARHLALAATSADPKALQSLDAAAEMARLRGAPAAAAELHDLAIGLGGDSPQRRIRSASHHFNAGDTVRARALLEETIEQLAPGPLRAEALGSLTAVRLLDGSFLEAARLLERALNEVGDDLAPRAQMLITLSFAQLNAGLLDAAERSIEKAVASAEHLGHSHLLSQALSMQVMVRFMRGGGLDESNLQRALELEDHESDTPVTLRPSMQRALLLAWTGRLEQAYDEILAMRQRCAERGEESELMFVGVHSVLIDIWRGDFTDAALVAEDAMDRAMQLGGDLPLSVALMIRAAVSAYAGREEDTRTLADDALAASQRCRSNLLAEWPITITGFLDVSLGNYQAALTALEPMLATLDPPPKGTEILVASFVPDAVEAMIQLRQHDQAEALIGMLERNGQRLDRAWMLAVGGRCRAMLLAAQGDLDAALDAATTAMSQHERLPMPFERARTQVVLGQLERRQRHRDASTRALRDALEAFERLGTRLWADRARAELARTDVSGRPKTELTVSEQRVAELAASGMTNRDVAAALFISPKTVEANLVRIYRKLGIHSRAELGRLMGKSDS